MAGATCCNVRVGANVPIAEGASKVTILNVDADEIRVCDVDGCLVVDSSERCDKLLKIGDRASVLIELKGRDVEKAKRQLEKSFLHGNVKAQLSGTLSALIVSSKVRVPRFNTFLLRSKVEFKKKFKANFDVKNAGCSISTTFFL